MYWKIQTFRQQSSCFKKNYKSSPNTPNLLFRIDWTGRSMFGQWCQSCWTGCTWPRWSSYPRSRCPSGWSRCSGDWVVASTSTLIATYCASLSGSAENQVPKYFFFKWMISDCALKQIQISCIQWEACEKCRNIGNKISLPVLQVASSF